MKIRKGDKVKVTTGKNKNAIGVVLKVHTKEGKVTVEGVNVHKRAVKKSETNNENYVFLQHPVHASNVRLVDENGVYVKDRSNLPAVAIEAEEVKKKSTTTKKTKAVKSETKPKSKIK